MELKTGYKQTEVGMIPSDWEVKILQSLSEKIMVGIASSATHAYRENGIVMFRNQNIKPNLLDDTDILYIAPEYEAIFKNKRLKAGDLLTARTGYPGTTCLVPVNYEGAQSFTTLISRVRDNLVNSKYLCFYLNSEKGQLFFEQNQIGGGQKNVNAGTLKLMPIPLPPTKSEQTAIATALSDTDQYITHLEKLIAKKRNIKQGAMQELLKPKEGWVVKKLGEVGKIVTGSTPPTQISAYWNGSIPWVTPTDISNFEKNIHITEREISAEGLEILRKLPENTLLVTCIASIGKNAILKKAGACNQQINAIIPNSGHDVDFLYYLIENNRHYILSKAGITATLIISKNDFSEIEFFVPSSKDEQMSIATILSDMDSEIAALEAKLSKAQSIKQGMMQQLLTGKIRLI